VYLLIQDKGDDGAELAWLEKVLAFVRTTECDGDLPKAERGAIWWFATTFLQDSRWPVDWPWPELSVRLIQQYGDGAVSYWNIAVEGARAKTTTKTDLDAVLTATTVQSARYGMPPWKWP
jgi:hypothetical protein